MAGIIRRRSIWFITGVGLFVLVSYMVYVCTLLGQNPHKLWLHRTNSIEKLYEKEARFPNFEVDVVFRPNGVFDVTHDMDVTYRQELDPYFKDIARDNDYMWLDVKNLTAENASAMLQHLNGLCKQYGVSKRQLILESRNRKELARFTESGYYTSYYVDFPKPGKLEEWQVDSCVHFLRNVAKSNQVKALSFPAWWYGPINQSLDHPIDLLTWKHRTTEFEFMALPHNRQMLLDPQLKVILIKSKGEYHR